MSSVGFKLLPLEVPLEFRWIYMPLIICPDCNNSVSSDAQSCLKCGRPIRPKDNALLGVIFYIVIIASGFVLARIFYQTPQVAFIPWVIGAGGLVFIFINKLLSR